MGGGIYALRRPLNDGGMGGGIFAKTAKMDCAPTVGVGGDGIACRFDTPPNPAHCRHHAQTMPRVKGHGFYNVAARGRWVGEPSR